MSCCFPDGASPTTCCCHVLCWDTLPVLVVTWDYYYFLYIKTWEKFGSTVIAYNGRGETYFSHWMSLLKHYCMHKSLWVSEVLPQGAFTHWHLHPFPSKECPLPTLSLCGSMKPTNHTSGPGWWEGLSRSVSWLLLSWWLAQGLSRESTRVNCIL